MRREVAAARLDLGGAWRISPRPGAAGEPDERAERRRAARSIELPCAWQTLLGPRFHGAAWLRRRVHLPATRRPGARRWLRFESVATDLRAWIDGAPAGAHSGDFVPFQFELAHLPRDGGPFDLALCVDERPAEPPRREGDLQRGHITKGFHDVISLQHGGVWQPLWIETTGDLCARPDGVAAAGDLERREVRVTLELEPHRGGRAEVSVLDPDGRAAGHAGVTLEPAGGAVVRIPVARPVPWSPRRPSLYRARVRLWDGHGQSQVHDLRFGFRTVVAEGRDILLNGEPILLRGVLDWGHAPGPVAPVYGPRATRAVLRRLRRMGFNTLCLCMWYAPRVLYELADELGVLLWQEHPVWQSSMDPAHLPEYRRLYQAFLRRDRRHPSVVLVSATCEHPCFDPALARWWWAAARGALPATLLQVQTASFKWADHERSDLYDEHTYDNPNRWVSYLADVEAHLAPLPPKPFVMGETALFTSWPDVPALARRTPAWWRPRAFDHMKALESGWRRRFGADLPARLRRDGDRFHLLGRRFAVEQFRRRRGFAGIVMNHLRDVPACQCGFMDDLDRWRFAARATRGWLADAALLLCTPEERRGFAGPATLECRLAISNFGPVPLRGRPRVTLAWRGGRRVLAAPLLRAPAGTVPSVPLRLPLPEVARPTRLRVDASMEGAEPNHWDLWIVPRGPQRRAAPRRVLRFDGLPFEPGDGAADPIERGYSRGFGLPVREFTCVLPDPGRVAPWLPPWSGAGDVPEGATALLTHRLTPAIVAWMERGGRVVLLASKAAGGLGTQYEWLFGQVPLVIDGGPWRGLRRPLVDLLLYDLTRRSARVIPIEALGIAERVDPLVRLVYTHDQRDRVRFFDLAFMSRVGRGLLIASSLDHSEDAGRYLLERLLRFAAGPGPRARGRIDAGLVRSWATA
jgi:hypothetical protein